MLHSRTDKTQHGVKNESGWTWDPEIGPVNYFPNYGNNRVECGSYGLAANIWSSWDAITVAAWIRPASIINYASIIGTMSTSSYGWFLYEFTGSGGTFGLSIWSSTGYTEICTTTNDVFAGELTLVAASFLWGVGTTALYANGQPKETNWIQDNGYSKTGTTTGTFWIGNDAWLERYYGNIGPVMVWDRFLSPAEHLRLYTPATRWELFQANDALYTTATGPVLTAQQVDTHIQLDWTV